MIVLAALALCVAVDGDTLRCGGERIRLLAIDAPEIHDCPSYRRCVEGDGQAAKQTMAELIRGQTVTIERVGHDRFGRTLGVVYAGGVNLSCEMLARGQAIYMPQWDNGKRIANECP